MKRGVITGASRGIGRAIALRLAGSDFQLILQGRDEKALAETCQKVTEKGGQADPVIADLADPASIESLVEVVGSEPLHLLVNNAGNAVVKPFEKVTLEEWRESFAVNVTAPFLLSRGLVRFMSEGSAIINILSIAAKTGIPDWSVYCMSKFALEGFSQSIREELRGRGIRVINIYPGATDTDIWKNVPGDWPREKMIKPGEIAEAVYYAVNRPSSVLVENLKVTGIAGKL